MARETKRAICHFCYGRCRVLIHTENGRFVGSDEDTTYPLGPHDPPTQACLKRVYYKEFIDHPQRLSFPLKRVGEKGEGKWRRISWDQAFDEIANKLQKLKDKYGPETLSLTSGTLRTTGQFRGRFFHLFGSPNYCAVAGRICHDPHIMTALAVVGWLPRIAVTYPHEDPGGAVKGRTRCFLLAGIDPSQSFGRAWRSIQEGKAKGMKLIVLDPRRTKTAEIADCHLQLRPATDTAVLMAMVNVIIQEGLYDKEFVTKWCHGFDEVMERAKEYTPEKAAEISWVPADKIREAARMFAANKPAQSWSGMGLEHYPNHIEAIHARYILTAITGNIDIEGGMYIPGPPKDLITESDFDLEEMLPEEQRKKQIGADRFKLLSLPGYDAMKGPIRQVWGHMPWVTTSLASAHAPSVLRAIVSGKPYPVRAMFCSANNPMVDGGNTKMWYKALKALDLYVVCDYWMTPSACLADYALPTASWLERPFMYAYGGGDTVVVGGEQALPASVRGKYDRKTDYDFFRGLAIRLGQAEYWPWENLEQVYDHQLSPRGITWRQFIDQGGFYKDPEEYRKHEKVGFGTKTGKVELYSTVLEQLGYDPLPRYEESSENPVTQPELAKEYPLYCVTGSRFLPYFHSEVRHIDSIRKRRPYPHVQIHPDTAKKYGIKSGEWVWIESPRGRIRQQCELFDGTDPRVVYPEHGWWFPELPAEEPWLHGVWESNANVLTNDDPDVCSKIAGGWPLKMSLCKIYPCKTY